MTERKGMGMDQEINPGRPSVRGLVRLLAWMLGGFAVAFAVFVAIGWAG